MELRHLRYFVAVATEANFRKAANTLNVSQPALSKQIKDLEDELGMQLLERHNAGARLTTSGQVFLEQARAILARVETAAAGMRDSGRGTREVFRLGQVGLIATGFFPRVLATLRDESPDVDVKLYEMGFPEQIAALQAGKIDVGMTAAPDAAIPQQIARRKVLGMKLMVALGRRHALAQKPRLSLTELLDETVLCFHDPKQPRGHKDRLEEVFAHFKLKTPRMKLMESYEAINALLVGGYGISIMPPFSQVLSVRQITLKPIKESDPLLNFEIRAMWLKNTTSTFPVRFLEILRHIKAGPTSPNKTKAGNFSKQV